MKGWMLLRETYNVNKAIMLKSIQNAPDTVEYLYTVASLIFVGYSYTWFSRLNVDPRNETPTNQ